MLYDNNDTGFVPGQPVERLDAHRVLVDGLSERQFLIIVRQEPDDSSEVLARLVLMLVSAGVKEARDGIYPGLDVSAHHPTNTIHIKSGVAQWLGRRSVAGGLSLIYVCSMVDV